MRLAIACLALLSLAAIQRGGCDGGPGPPPKFGCEGLACGEPCGLCPPGTPPERCPVPTFAATACNARGECVTAGTFACAPGEECRGKACGAECQVTLPCHYANPPCEAPVGLGHCAGDGRCVAGDPLPWRCYDPCAGKACGDACQLCPPNEPGCAETAVLKACDASGRCVTRTPSLACP
jgi:hypothetical protein